MILSSNLVWLNCIAKLWTFDCLTLRGQNGKIGSIIPYLSISRQMATTKIPRISGSYGNV